MRILFTLNSTNFGGMEKTVLDLVANLPKEDYQSFVVAPKGDLKEEFEKYSNFTVYNKIKSFDFSYLKFIISFIKRHKIEVVHANEPRIVFHTIIGAFIAGVPIRISHTHTPISHWQIHPFKKFINIILNTLVINLFSTYEVALTQFIKREKTKEGILPSKIVVIPNCLDSSFISKVLNKKPDFNFRKKIKLEDRFLILVLSRLTKEKNQNLVIDAIFEISKKYKNAFVLFVGKGEDFEFLKKRVIDLNLERFVRFETSVSDDEKIDYYQNCDLFLFPSLAEGFGITLLEAMYCTSPILSSDLKVIKEVTSHRIDYFKSNNKKSLVSKIKYYLDKKNLKIRDPKELNSNRDFINDNYSLEKYVTNYLKIYNRGI